MVVQHNMQAKNASRMYNITGSSQNKKSEKLSSGYRINRSADDAAGLSISEKMRRQIRGLDRGTKNTEDGISYCQVTDGALNEVHNMIHRLNELSIQAANGTNSDSDRQDLQNEVDQILNEINRIGNTTTFNNRYVFKGNYDTYDLYDISDRYDQSTDEAAEIVAEAEEIIVENKIENDAEFKDYKLTNVALGKTPFLTNNPDRLQLNVTVANSTKKSDGASTDLIYGNGSTSHSSVRISYDDGGTPVTNCVDLSQFNYVNNSSKIVGNVCSRQYTYNDGKGADILMTQTITVVDTDTEKKYKFDYSFENKSTTTDIKLEFMFHADTAYNSNDFRDIYYSNGARIEKTSMFTDAKSELGKSITSAEKITTGVPAGGFSICDTESALAFTEKVTYEGTKPNSVVFGFYNKIDGIDTYDNTDNMLGEQTLNGTRSLDMGFSLYYIADVSKSGGASSKTDFKFNYGIVPTDQDTNLAGITVTQADNIGRPDASKSTVLPPIKMPEKHYLKVGTGNMYIQSGAETMEGIILASREMNAKVIGLDPFDITTEESATESIDKIELALQIISDHRSLIGAQQNRLEHTVANQNNSVENTQSSESKLRDTDMAKTMVAYSKANILKSAGESMLAQSNQSMQNVLSLLQ